jgi:hypothetical protein
MVRAPYTKKGIKGERHCISRMCLVIQALEHSGWPVENGQFCRTLRFENIDGHSWTEEESRLFLWINWAFHLAIDYLSLQMDSLHAALTTLTVNMSKMEPLEALALAVKVRLLPGGWSRYCLPSSVSSILVACQFHRHINVTLIQLPSSRNSHEQHWLSNHIPDTGIFSAFHLEWSWILAILLAAKVVHVCFSKIAIGVVIIYHIITLIVNLLDFCRRYWVHYRLLSTCGIFCLPRYKGPRFLVSSDRPSFYSQLMYMCVPWPGSNLQVNPFRIVSQVC